MLKLASKRDKTGKMLEFSSTVEAGLVFTIPLVNQLALRLDANALSLADGAAVQTWEDSSGNGRNASQGSAGSRPTFVKGVQNGLPVVRFPGSKFFTFASGAFSSVTEAMLFVVVKVALDPNTEYLTGFNDFSADSGGNNHFRYGDGVIYDGFGTSQRKTTVNPAPSLAAWNIYCVSSKNGEWTSYLNNLQLYTTANNTFGFPSVAKLGQSKISSYSLAGDIGEFVIYKSALGATDRTSVYTYLKEKWGTP